MKVYFMGGGARLVENFGEYNPEIQSLTMISVLMQRAMSITAICF